MPESRINVNTLSAYQNAIREAVGKEKGAHKKITPELLSRLADTYFGAAPVEPGSTITFQGADRIEWTDPQGYKHVATRSLDGTDPNVGQWNDNTNRPKVLPDQGSQQLSQTLQGGINQVAQQTLQNILQQQQGQTPAAYDPGISGHLTQVEQIAQALNNPAVLATLDPATQQSLNQIRENTLAQLNQQFQQQSGRQLASLFGNRINQSSIATNAAGQLAQQQGLVTSQALSDAATRELQVRQYLSDASRQQQQLALQGLLGAAGQQLGAFQASTGAGQNALNNFTNLLQNLTGQQTQRDIAGGGLNMDQARLAETIRQFNKQWELAEQDFNLKVAMARKGSDVFGNALEGLGGSLLSFGLGQIPGLSSVLGGGISNTPAGAPGGTNPYSTTPFGLG